MQLNTSPEDQDVQLQEKTTYCEVLAKPWEVVGTDIYMINNENLLFIGDHHSQFPVVKMVESLLAKDIDTSSQGFIC